MIITSKKWPRKKNPKTLRTNHNLGTDKGEQSSSLKDRIKTGESRIRETKLRVQEKTGQEH